MTNFYRKKLIEAALPLAANSTESGRTTCIRQIQLTITGFYFELSIQIAYSTARISRVIIKYSIGKQLRDHVAAFAIAGGVA